MKPTDTLDHTEVARSLGERDARAEVSIPATVTTPADETISCTIVDLSTSGVFLSGATGLTEGTAVMVRFPPDPDTPDAMLHISGQVTRPNANGVGVAFDALDDDARERIQRHVTSRLFPTP